MAIRAQLLRLGYVLPYSSLRSWQLVASRLNSTMRSLHGRPCIFAGHNKWSKVKRPKMAADLERSKQITKLCSEITTCVRLGGHNPEFNVRLSSALSRAKRAGVPKATIAGAIESGKLSATAGGELVTYIGRGSSGYSLVIETLTNNRRRTRPEIKRILSKHGYVFKSLIQIIVYMNTL